MIKLPINKKINLIKEAANKCSLRAFIVGGAARDLILGAPIKDFDFLIEGSAIDFIEKTNFKIKSIHEKFDTVKIIIEDEEIDIASTRSETYPIPGGLPVVEKIGIEIEKDLLRRDFTINSIAIDISNGGIIDPCGGQKDIEGKLLRVLHKNSFIDDPTRILRGLDFKYRFGFEFEDETKNLIKNIVSFYDRDGLSMERIYLTLNKIFSSKSPDKILKEILEKNIYKIWMAKTELKPDMIEALENAAKIFNIKDKSGFYIMALESIPYVRAPFLDDYEIYNFFKQFKPEQIALYYFKTGDNSAIKYLKLKDIKIAATGKTLIDMGYSEGKIIGEIINSLTKEKILNPLKFMNLEDETGFIRKHFPL